MVNIHFLAVKKLMDYYENYKGLMCYTSEDLREYDGKWALIEGNLFFNKYGNHGLVNARLVQ